MQSKKYELSITFVEPLLGSQPGSKTPASDFLADRSLASGAHPDDVAESVSAVPESDRGTTVFHRDADGSPIVYNYQVKGALKEAAMILNGSDGHKNLRSKIETTVFVSPRRIPLVGKLGEHLERPLRAMTMQGPRVSLARSEQMEPGARFVCVLECIATPKFTCDDELLHQLLEHCQRLGFGQWRNSGLYGQFEWRLKLISRTVSA